jgi:NAD(P)-dependent dehydrogenase (short-subunit alcohol dehydrogenase family)
MNNVLPGFVENWPVDAATLAKIPLGRPVALAEVAALTAFLVSPEAASITGQSLRVDGGMTRSL